jgi:hypothetical protein
MPRAQPEMQGGLFGELSQIADRFLIDHQNPYWSWVWDFCSFHSPGWWRRHWEKTGLLEIETADTLTDGWKLRLEWNVVCEQFGDARSGSPD